jgi:hypothetical protein
MKLCNSQGATTRGGLFATPTHATMPRTNPVDAAFDYVLFKLLRVVSTSLRPTHHSSHPQPTPAHKNLPRHLQLLFQADTLTSLLTTRVGLATQPPPYTPSQRSAGTSVLHRGQHSLHFAQLASRGKHWTFHWRVCMANLSLTKKKVSTCHAKACVLVALSTC